ncbi:hypothetical protein I4U23_005386 [Adineta vaga]|nr:hypothetical protein I4U23_005386 [Adineta vaga]
MSSLILSILILAAVFIPTVAVFLFSQPKLECKPCVYHPECHCDIKCVQKQIMHECNLGVDSHNVLASHYTSENRTTRVILLLSLVINFLLILLLLFRKAIRTCYRAHRVRKLNEQQVAARQQTELYATALKRMLTPYTEQSPPQRTTSTITSDEPLFNLLSTCNLTGRK